MKLSLSIVLLGLASVVSMNAATISFDDGTAGSAIGSFYSGLGVTFSNGAWSSTAVSGATGLSLVDITDDGFNTPYSPSSTSPIVATFSSAQTFISILAADVGAAGARIDVYDALVGGNLIGTDSFVGTGSGVGVSQTLSVSAAGILRLQIYQVATISGDGVVFDNLSFDGSQTVPEPATLWMIVPGGALLALFKLRKRS